MNINYMAIDSAVWNIKAILMRKYGSAAADRDIAPLAWYITTGRASTGFLHLLLEAKPFMIARKLHQAGSYDDAIKAICNYIHYERSNEQ